MESGFARCFIEPRRILAQFPGVVAGGAEIERVRHGNAVNLPEFTGAPRIRVFDSGRSDAHLIAIAQRIAGTLFQPKIVLI